MKARRHTRRSDWSRLVLPCLAGIALFACGCASSGSSGGDGGTSSASGGSAAPGSGGSQGGGGSGGVTSGGSGGAHGSGGLSGSGGAKGSGGFLGSGGSSGTASGGTTGAGGASSGTGGISPPHCYVTVQLLSPSSPLDVEVGIPVRVQATANEFPVMPLGWSWMIRDPAGQTVISTNPTGDDAVAEFPVAIEGTYLIMATAMGDPNCAMARLNVVANRSQGLSFAFHVTARGYPLQDVRVKLAEGLSGTIPLDAGQMFTVKPVDSFQGTVLDTYVRISRLGQPFDFDGDTAGKPVMTNLLPTQTYALLIAPVDPGGQTAGGAGSTAGSPSLFAPLLMSSMPGNWPPQELPIDAGTKMSGRTLTAGGMPIQNARMQLRSRSGAPSTIGFSDDMGALTLRGRDGSMSAIIVPPDGSGLPIATTDDGAIVATTGVALSLTMQWAAPAQSTLTVEVRGADGTSVVANAQARLVSSGAAYSAGTLTVQAPGATAVKVATTASVTDSLTTGDDGRVTFPPYPAGAYTLTVIPPAAAAPAAVTTMPITLTGGAGTQTIALARKVALTGTLSPKAGAAGATLTAIDVGNACTGNNACPSSAPLGGTSLATGTVVTGKAGDDGTFSLAVDPDRTYQIIVQPPAGGSMWGRSVLPSFRVCSTATAPCQTASGGSLGTINLAAGMRYQGVLWGKNSPVAGGSIQVFCVSSSAICGDTKVSLAEATSLGDGSFSVILPVPAGTPAALNGRVSADGLRPAALARGGI